MGELFIVRSVINGSFAFSERVQPLSNPVPYILWAKGGEKLRNRVYIANAQLRLHENRGFSRILGA